MTTRGPSKASIVDVVEAAYEVGDVAGDDEWAAGVLRAFRPAFDRGLGVGVYMTTPATPFEPVAASGLPDGWETAMGAIMTTEAGPALTAPPGPCMTLSDMIGRDAVMNNPSMQREWRRLGVADGIGLVASDGTGCLLTFIAPLPAIESLAPRAKRRFAQVAAHIVAGWRLRRLVAAEPIAILSPGGKIVHALASAQPRSAREQLRDAALAMDRARGRLRRDDEDEALALWRVLVDGKWSIVDRFDSGGRRFLVAHENQPHVPEPRALSLRERQVVAFTALGHSLKLIGYELGISPSAVSGTRTRALRKLGVRSRRDVARLFRL